MSISKILKICAFCYIGLSNCNAISVNAMWNHIVNNLIHVNDVELVHGIISVNRHPYTDISSSETM